MELARAPMTRNSETKGKTLLKRPGPPSEETGHFYIRIQRLRTQAKPNSLHLPLTPIML